MTIHESAGVTAAGQGLDGIAWDILGQTYKPVQHSMASFAFDTLFPPGTFVPPHIHPEQDEYIRVLEGRFDLWLDGAEDHRRRRRPGAAATRRGAWHLQTSRAPMCGPCSGWRRRSTCSGCSIASTA